MSTVSGAIILALIGSALFVLLSKALKILIVKLIPSIGTYYKNWTEERGYKQGIALSYLQASEGHVGMISIIVFKSLKCLVYFIVSVLWLFAFINLFSSGNQVLSWGSYTVLVLSMVCAFMAQNEYNELYSIQSYFHDKAIEKAGEFEDVAKNNEKN